MWSKEKIDQLRKECISRAQLDMLYLTRDDFAEELLDAVNYIKTLQDEIERLKSNRDGWAARSKEQFDRIGVALEKVREHRESGEPSRSDAEEIEALVAEIENLRT